MVILRRFLPLFGVVIISAAMLGSMADRLRAMTSATSKPLPAQVATIAGSGQFGNEDGSGLTASFLFPSGLAQARDGTVFITDEAANRVRALKNGDVETVAGSGSIGADGMSVAGGFRDGPANQAQFNRPVGIAIGNDGSIYVADSLNACIRKIDHGIVSTVYGKPGENAGRDGDRDAARFHDPRSIAFDRLGDMYVADNDFGLRFITPDGQVSTIKTKAIGERRMLDVAVYDDGTTIVVVVATPNFLIVYHPKSGTDEALNLIAAEGDRPFGHPTRLAFIDHRQLIFTDSKSSNIHYLRLPALPYTAEPYTAIIAGGDKERAVDNIDFKVGSRDQARFDVPLGVLVANSTAIVADAGNRRIRRIPLPNFRISESGTTDLQASDSAHEDIMFIGASWAFWDSLGDDSICGQLEFKLNKRGVFGRPVRCHAVRIDGAPLQAMADYLEDLMVPRKMDIVVIDMNDAEVASLNPQGTDAENLVSLRALLIKLRDDLGANHTQLKMVWTYHASEISDRENYYERDISSVDRYFPVGFRDKYMITVKAEIAIGADLGIQQIDTHQAYLDYERSASTLPLYGTSDSHQGAYGNAFLADSIASALQSK